MSWGEALYVPPVSRAWFLRSAVAWERAGATISWDPFNGVHLVEASKQVYRVIPARRARRQAGAGAQSCARADAGSAGARVALSLAYSPGGASSPPSCPPISGIDDMSLRGPRWRRRRRCNGKRSAPP